MTAVNPLPGWRGNYYSCPRAMGPRQGHIVSGRPRIYIRLCVPTSPQVATPCEPWPQVCLSRKALGIPPGTWKALSTVSVLVRLQLLFKTCLLLLQLLGILVPSYFFLLFTVNLKNKRNHSIGRLLLMYQKMYSNAGNGRVHLYEVFQGESSRKSTNQKIITSWGIENIIKPILLCVGLPFLQGCLL